MEKETKPTGQRSKHTNYFRYQMKDTNQLLKDFISCNMTDNFCWSESANKQMSKALPKIQDSSISNYFQHEEDKNLKKQEECGKQMRKKAVKSEDDLQNEQNSNQKCLIDDSSFSLQRKKKRQNSMEDLILQKFQLSSSENEDFEDGFKGSIQKYKSKDFLDNNTVDRYEDSFKQIKKQRKGLANISLRVKNIVSQHKKLTYKQVSDYVLQYSQEEINLLEPIQRTKQVKNIKRRVYDALNVLVAVGILGKHQRCVCTTQWTEIPGKKHSPEWHKINTKIQYMNKLKRNCEQKKRALNHHIEKYHAITALRNKHMQQTSQQSISKDRNKSSSPNHQAKHEKSDLKLVFPVIVFFPGFGEDPNQKLTVELEQDIDEQNKNGKEGSTKRSKIKVSGKNMTMMGDFDCALEMELQKYRILEQEQKILKEIQQYAKEVGNKKQSNFKFEVDDFGEGSIEEYFNDQMFQSK